MVLNPMPNGVEPMREAISACVTAGNEERNIRRCLESVKWADEIVVVDSYSEDKTADISREYTDLVHQHRWLGYIGQKNLIKGMASGPWILFADADEEISSELRDEILREFESGATDHCVGFEFPRMVKYLGRWIRHGDWYPDVKLRLFRKDRGRCGGREPHDRMIVDGPIKRLEGRVYHYTYADISAQLATMNKFSTISAQTQAEEGEVFAWSKLLVRPLLRFLRGYVLKLGFLDGFPGLVIAVTAAYGVFSKYAKLWEIQKLAHQKEGKDSATTG